MGTYSTFNEQALALYREAMPGYEVIGIENKSYYNGWLNTDALHCRTRGVMDFDMLYVDHRDVLFGEQEWQDSMAVTSRVIAYSGAELKQDSLLVYYSIDGGEYQTAAMTPTGNADEYVAYIKGYQKESKVDYYVFAADESGRNSQQPVFGKTEPHTFTLENGDAVVENYANEIEVYPNPVSDKLYVETELDVEEIMVYDVYGRQQSTDNSQQTLGIDVSGLNSGVYMLKVMTENGEFVSRFVKK